MSKRALAWTAVVALIVALISVFAADRGIAEAVRHSGFEKAAVVVQVREALDFLTGSSLTNGYGRIGSFMLAGVLVAIGLVGLLARATNAAGRALIFTGLVQAGTIEVVAIFKAMFGRLRPYQLLESGDWSHVWFAGGTSFPSGHVAFFAGLFVPLAYLFPKFRVPLLAVPLFIVCARIDEGAHFLSDVLGSVAVAALVTLIAAVVLGRWVRPRTSRAS